jgi:hypothetical protein
LAVFHCHQVLVVEQVTLKNRKKKRRTRIRRRERGQRKVEKKKLRWY